MSILLADIALACVLLIVLGLLGVNAAQQRVNQAAYQWLKLMGDHLEALTLETAQLAADLDELKREVRLEAQR